MDLDSQVSSLGLSSSALPPPPPTSTTPSLTSGARELFKNKTARGQDLITDTLKSAHERPITCLSICSPPGGPVTKIATSALDGKLIIWNLPELELDLALLEM